MANIPADFPTDSLVVPQPVIYTASDGMQIHGQLFLPADLQPGQKRKAVVFMHGGSRRQMLLGWHYRDYYYNAYAMNQFLANQGYIVFSINYRSGIGYGQAFRMAVNQGAGGASEFHDVEGAGSVPAHAPRRRPRPYRPLGRVLRRLSHGSRAGARFRSLRGRRRFPRRSRLEHAPQRQRRDGGSHRCVAHRVRVFADGGGEHLAVARPADPRR